MDIRKYEYNTFSVRFNMLVADKSESVRRRKLNLDVIVCFYIELFQPCDILLFLYSKEKFLLQFVFYKKKETKVTFPR